MHSRATLTATPPVHGRRGCDGRGGPRTGRAERALEPKRRQARARALAFLEPHRLSRPSQVLDLRSNGVPAASKTTSAASARWTAAAEPAESGMRVGAGGGGPGAHY